MNSENHPHSGVLAPDVSLPLPQLDVRITQLQDPCAVDPAFVQTRDEEFKFSTRQIIHTLTVNQAVIYTCSTAAKSKVIFTLGSINTALEEAAVMSTED